VITCRVSSLRTVSHSTGATPTGPHWTRADDGSVVVQPMEVVYDEIRTGAALTTEKARGPGEVVPAFVWVCPPPPPPR
jgi:hypothetical protein